MATDRHYLVVAHPFLGHWKPLIGFVHRLLRKHAHLRLTLFLPASQFRRTTKALRALSDAGEDVLLESLYNGHARCVAYGSHLNEGEEERLVTVQDMPQMRGDAVEWIEKLYPGIIQGRTLIDSFDRTIEAWPLPVSAVIWDFAHTRSIGQALRKVEEREGVPKPLYLEITPASPHWMNVMIYDKCQPQPIRDYYAAVEGGISTDDAFLKHVKNNTEMLDVPDCRPMRVHEIIGTGEEPFLPVNLLTVDAARVAQSYVDAHIFYYSAHLGREDVQRSEKSKRIYRVGMLQRESGRSHVRTEVTTWLEQMEKADGERSVGYISFGSLFFSPTASQIPLLVSSLIERGLPALISLGNCKEAEAQSLRAYAQADERGLLRVEEWVDQEAVLSHPAVGWFMTHAGQGAVLESLMAAIPTILWPCGTDQPFLANQLSQVEQVGIELVQVRLSEKGKTLARGTYILATDEAIKQEIKQATKRLDGPDANDFRRRAETLRKILLEEYSPGGAVDEALESLGHLEIERQ